MTGREMLEMHVAKHYTELNDIMRNGVDLNIQGQTEHFNIIVFLVADLSFVKEILGKCSSSHEFGYFHCEMDRKSWSSPRLCLGVPQSIEKMKDRGDKAVKLGKNPDKSSSQYKKFTHQSFSQWVCLKNNNNVEYQPNHNLKNLNKFHAIVLKYQKASIHPIPI